MAAAYLAVLAVTFVAAVAAGVAALNWYAKPRRRR
jgi:hypothetical protein